MALRLRRVHLRAKSKKSPKAKRITKKRKAKKNGTAKKSEANGNKRKIFAQKQAKTTKERGISHTKGKRKAASSSNGDTIVMEIEEPTSTSRLEAKGDRGNGRGIGMENSHPPIRKVARLLPLHDNTLSRMSTLVSLTTLHEKPEKEEKRIVRDDRKWMKEVAYREHLLRKNEPPPQPPPNYRIMIVKGSIPRHHIHSEKT